MQPRVIPLTQGYVAIISGEDYRKVNKYSWHVHISKGTNRKHGQPYARANIKGQKVYLHRFVMNPDEDMHVDHKNNQTLDNRRDNLEVVSFDENMKRRRKRKICPKNGKKSKPLRKMVSS